ncbi:MAG: hypothetical protein LBD16_02080 [Oscillospiraceae bacterium]|jgi:uncharacterized membrane protein YcgQ (UPF0703/DUF1980 family)|nr:hypothetical protein [Oscillospiraceae bacterium]
MKESGKSNQSGKLISLLALLALVLYLAAGCGASSASESNGTTAADAIDITEKMFLTQTMDIYTNTEDYLGKTIRYEGIFGQYSATLNGEPITYSSVFRYGPSCCVGDQTVGFEVAWDDAYPKENAWVEVVGVLEEYDEEGSTYLRLRLSSLNVKDKRGLETVTQ